MVGFVVNYKVIMAAIVFIIFDIITGVLSAFITGTFKSSVMRSGGLRKLFLIIVICFGVALDFVQDIADFGLNVPATAAICGYIILMEIMSCIENINKAYPGALPKSLIKVLNTSAEEKGIETSTETEKLTE